METSLQSAPWKELEVPGEPGVYFCARHKNVKTRLRCGSCEKPICPKCTQYGPTGARCGDCLSLRSSHIYKLSPLGALAAFGVAFGAGVLGAIILSALGMLSLLALFYASALGPALGKSIVRVAGGKRGTKVALMASAGFVVGALLAALLTGALFHIILWITLALAVGSLWAFLK